MRKVKVGMLVAVVLAMVGTVLADKDKPDSKLRLEFDLLDGSCVIGTPGIDSVPLEASFARLDIPLKNVTAVKMDEDRKAATIDLQNGDQLKGIVKLEPVKLETVFGSVLIGMEHIKEFRVIPTGGGALPEWLQRGLALYYSFDRDEGGKVTDQSGKGAHGNWVGAPMYEAGVKGQAALFRSKATYIVSSSEKLNMNGWKEATVSIWVLIKRYTTYGHVINRGPITTDQPGAFALAIGSGYGRGSLSFQGSATESSVEYSAGGENLSLNRWYNLAMTYDGTALRYYIDGQLDKEVPLKKRNTPIWDGTGTKFVIGNMSRLPFVTWEDMYMDGLVDEVYIFNRALTEREIKQTYDVQKPKQ